MFPYSARLFHVILFVIALFFAFKVIYKLLKENKSKSLQIEVVLILYPLAAYFIYVMVDSSEIHSLMTFGEVMPFFVLAWLIEASSVSVRIEKMAYKLAILLMGVLLFLNIRLSNICYLKADILQSQAISYFTVLMTRIQSLEGYSTEKTIVYINEPKIDGIGVKGANYLFDSIEILPYNRDSIINTYSWKQFMTQWCGFKPILGSLADEQYKQELLEMSCYPDDGSIKIIDDMIVVKFDN